MTGTEKLSHLWSVRARLHLKLMELNSTPMFADVKYARFRDRREQIRQCVTGSEFMQGALRGHYAKM